MQIIPPALMLALLGSSITIAGAQAPAQHPPAAAAQPQAQSTTQSATQPATQSAGPAPSATLKPALDTVQQSVGSIKTDKWKKGTVRDEADANLNSIQRDLVENVPPLLSKVDAAPASVSTALPVARHIDALYDVLLRIYEAARVSAPPDQIASLQQAMTTLDKARHAFNDRLQTQATTLEKWNVDLQTTMRNQQAAKPAVTTVAAPPCPTTPAKKPAAKKKPKPSATTSTTQPATTPSTAPKQ